jgi:secretion/DNA translocation related TadE-like protein
VSRGERGAATVLALPLLGVLTVAAVLLAHLGGALVASRRVAAAADLAALAAAAALQRGGDACDAAARVVTLNRAQLAGCRVDGEDVLVSARLDYRGVLGRTFRVAARARAGPAPPG